MIRRLFVLVFLLALGPVVVACDDDDPIEPGVTYDLTFTGDDTFQGAHGDQTITVAVVEEGTGQVAANATGTVSANANPSFEFTFADVLEAESSYHLDYWIDSNFGTEGVEGSCDPPAVDHQWRLAVGMVTGDVTLNDTHRPTETESVCSTFE